MSVNGSKQQGSSQQITGREQIMLPYNLKDQPIVIQIVKQPGGACKYGTKYLGLKFNM